MSLRVRQWLFLIILAIVGYQAIFILPKYISFTDEVADFAANETEGAAGPEYTSEGMSVFESQKGRKDFELKAARAAGTKKDESWEVNEVEVKFFTDNLLSYTVTGDRGVVEGKNLRIEGHAKTRSANGYQFTSDLMFYTANNRELRSPGPVRLTGPKESNIDGVVLTGNRMVTYVNEQRMVIEENIRAKKPLSDGGILELISDVAEFSGKSKEAKFRGRMKMNYLTYEVEGPEVTFFNSPAGVLNRVEIYGGVKMKDPEHNAKAETVIIDVPSKKVTLRGSPKVIHLDDEFVGEEIILLDGGKQVKIERTE